MKNRPLFYGSLILFLVISLCTVTLGAKFVKELRPSKLEIYMKDGDCVSLSGQVYDISEKDSYQILYLKNNSIIYQNESFEESKIIIYDEEKLNIEIGNHLRVSGEVSFFETERNLGCFDQKLYYQKQKIHASVWAENVEITDFETMQLKNSLHKFKYQWRNLLCERMGKEQGEILCAMLLAEKSGMDAETKELYQVNGVAHVLAISGLHLSVIGNGLYQLFRRSSGSFAVGGIGGILFLLLYILMIGMSVSVLRSLIMFLFRVGADMTGRHYDSLTAVAVAALVTILWQPLCLYDGGFWLSYGAILGIMLLLPLFEGFRGQGLWASASVNLITLPVLLYCFFEIPLYGTILNLAVIPLMTVILTSGLAGSICCMIFIPEGPFGENGIGFILLWVCKGIFWIYEKLCMLVLELPYARIVTGKPRLWEIIFYYVCLMVAVLILKKKTGRKFYTRKQILTALGVMILGIGVLMLPEHFSKEVQVTMLDVGQGDSIFVRGPDGTTYLVDGGSSDMDKLSKYQLEPFLKAQGVRELDYVFLSHGDQDHINGIMEMIDRMNTGVSIETIIFPDKGYWDENLKELAKKAMDHHIRVVTISEGECLKEKELGVTCLAPTGNMDGSLKYEEGNESSMVLALKYGEFDMIFTGDVEEAGEEFLTETLEQNYRDVKWEVLKVAHHGSKNSSSEKFLNIVKPAYALISAGRDNSYGHPHEETLERLEDSGSRILSTQDSGAITIVTDGETMRVDGYLE